MPKITGLDEFKAVGGDPSNKWRSSYSAICTLIGEIGSLPGEYVDSAKQNQVKQLDQKLKAFHPDGVAATSPQKKIKEMKAVSDLKAQMPDYLEVVKVSALIDKMCLSPMTLIRNTAVGLKKFAFIVKRAGLDNAFFTGRACISITVTNFWSSENLAIGVLVHEYHHSLTNRLPAPYKDEYVAHWKQYLAMGAPQSKFDNLNTWLCDTPGGYEFATKPNMPAARFNGPDDAGTIWTKYLDNVIH